MSPAQLVCRGRVADPHRLCRRGTPGTDRRAGHAATGDARSNPDDDATTVADDMSTGGVSLVAFDAGDAVSGFTPNLNVIPMPDGRAAVLTFTCRDDQTDLFGPVLEAHFTSLFARS